MKDHYIVMGIDPGVRRTGYAILEKKNRDVIIKAGGVITPSVKISFPLRIYQILTDTKKLISRYNVDVIAIEKLFTVYKHPNTAIQMAHARGAVLCAAADANIKIVNISATHIKKAITGNGRATKSQIQKAMMVRLGLKKKPTPPDLADALAIAFCFILETPSINC